MFYELMGSSFNDDVVDPRAPRKEGNHRLNGLHRKPFEHRFYYTKKRLLVKGICFNCYEFVEGGVASRARKTSETTPRAEKI